MTTEIYLSFTGDFSTNTGLFSPSYPRAPVEIITTENSIYQSSDSMPSPHMFSEVDDGLTQVTVPPGSEKVLSIRRMARSEENQTRTTTNHGVTAPLTVMTDNPSVVTNSMEQNVEYRSNTITLRKKTGRSRSKRDGRTNRSHRSSVRELNDQPVTHSVFYDDNHPKGRRVISSLEMSIPFKSRSMGALPINIESEVSPRMEHRRHTTRNSRKSLHRQSAPWLMERMGDYDEDRWRYSAIFAPENAKLRSKFGRSRKTTKSSTLQPSPSIPTVYSPFVPVPVSYCPGCVQSACPRCAGNAAYNHSVNHDALHQQNYLFNSAYPSSATLPLRTDSIYHQPNSVTMPPPPGYLQHQHHHHHHSTASQYQQMNELRQADSRRSFYTGSRGTMGYHSVEDLLVPGIDSEEGPNSVDLLEIEYATTGKDESATKLTSLKQQNIMRMAKQFEQEAGTLKEIAKRLKLALDKQLGGKWHVIVGDDSFGSNLASLPGALANFKLEKHVFLIWQT